MMVPLIWKLRIPSSSHPLFPHPFSLQVMTEATDDVPNTVGMNEAQKSVCTPPYLLLT